MKKLIIDASAFVSALLPDEPLRDKALKILSEYVSGKVILKAPSLLIYEVGNSLLKAERRKEREIDREAVDSVLREVERLKIPLVPVSPQDIVVTARKYGIWGYDASYVTLSEKENVPLVTADKRLYNTIQSRFSLIKYLGNA